MEFNFYLGERFAMENEQIKIFNDQHIEIGVETRENIHKYGYWHETFHCWFISQEEGTDYVYLQLRSDRKKDFPSLLDITAAGHLLADETVHDGVREVKEELGIDIAFHELIPLGVLPDRIVQSKFIDNEFAHVFLYHFNGLDESFVLDTEEVSGIVKVELSQFEQLWAGEVDKIHVKGFKQEGNDQLKSFTNTVQKEHFVPHPHSYYKAIVSLVNKYK
jgi:isopentenyldiphosphate isomerase